MKREESGANVFIIGHKCYRCNHKWVPSNKDKLPKVCPSCKSPYWDRPRIKQEKENRKNGK